MKSKKLLIFAPAMFGFGALVGCGGNPTLESITATTGSFFYNETIKKSDITVTATYSNKTTKTLTDFTVEGIGDNGYTFVDSDVNTDKTFKVTASEKSYDLKVNAGVRFNYEKASDTNYYRITSANENSKGAIYVPSKIKIDNVDCEIKEVGKYGAEKGAFEGNTDITEIHLPVLKGDGAAIASSAFKGCTNLTVCELKSASEFGGGIGSYAFQNCSSLKEIIIPGKCTQINEKAFDGCINLKTVTLNEAETETDSLYYEENDINGLLKHAETIYTPEGTVAKIEAKSTSYIANNYDGAESGQEARWKLKS